MKKTILLVLVSCLMLSFAACSKTTDTPETPVTNTFVADTESSSADDPEGDSEETSTDSSEEEMNQEDATGVSLVETDAEELFTSEDFKVTITGGTQDIERTLPFPAQDLIDAGWTLEGADENLSYGTYTWENKVTCGDCEMLVQIENNSDHDRPTAECQVVKICSDVNNPDTVTVDGFRIGDNVSILKEKYGEPLIVTEREEGETYVYSTDIYKRFDASYDENGNCTSFDLQWMESD